LGGGKRCKNLLYHPGERSAWYFVDEGGGFSRPLFVDEARRSETAATVDLVFETINFLL
jgi:hypothetical protein